MGSISGIKGGVNGSNLNRGWGDFNEPKAEPSGLGKPPKVENSSIQANPNRNLRNIPLTTDREVKVTIGNNEIEVKATEYLKQFGLPTDPLPPREITSFPGTAGIQQFSVSSTLSIKSSGGTVKTELNFDNRTFNPLGEPIIPVEGNVTFSKPLGKDDKDKIDIKIGSSGAEVNYVTDPKARVSYDLKGAYDPSDGTTSAQAGIAVNYGKSNIGASFNTDGTVRIRGALEINSQINLIGGYNFLTTTRTASLNFKGMNLPLIGLSDFSLMYRGNTSGNNIGGFVTKTF
jgi:hypothetical protein